MSTEVHFDNDLGTGQTSGNGWTWHPDADPEKVLAYCRRRRDRRVATDEYGKMWKGDDVLRFIEANPVKRITNADVERAWGQRWG